MFAVYELHIGIYTSGNKHYTASNSNHWATWERFDLTRLYLPLNFYRDVIFLRLWYLFAFSILIFAFYLPFSKSLVHSFSLHRLHLCFLSFLSYLFFYTLLRYFFQTLITFKWSFPHATLNFWFLKTFFKFIFLNMSLAIVQSFN